jgi:FKBP-type peptidyl-prolyl cis-trans isomerase
LIRVEKKVGFVRKTAAIIVTAAAVVALLAGCAPTNPTDLTLAQAGCTPAATSGSASKSITASGALGSDPKAKVPTPTTTKKVEVSTLIKGTGAPLQKNSIVNVQATLLLGTTGAVANATSYDKSTPLQLTVGDKTTPLGRYLTCARDGSRTVVVMSALQYLGKTALSSSGLTASTGIVLVLDVQKAFPGKATGALQPVHAGFPSVVTAPDGTPAITLPDGATRPTTVSSEVIRKGDGATVKEGDTLLLHYSGVNWSSKDVFATTWTSKLPEVVAATGSKAAVQSDGTTAAATTLDVASAKAIIGQKVGSQILVIVPVKDGYTTGYKTNGVPAGYPTSGTMVFVYDILGVE